MPASDNVRTIAIEISEVEEAALLRCSIPRTIRRKLQRAAQTRFKVVFPIDSAAIERLPKPEDYSD